MHVVQACTTAAVAAARRFITCNFHVIIQYTRDPYKRERLREGGTGGKEEIQELRIDIRWVGKFDIVLGS